MTELNPILENLQQRTVQEAPVKLIYADNDFSVFDKGASEFYGAEDEFISDQPLEGIKWNKDLTEKDFKTLPPVFSAKLGMSFSMSSTPSSTKRKWNKPSNLQPTKQPL